MAYHAVPTNSRSLGAFRDHVIRLWGRTLRRRSQKHTLTWERMGKVADDWLPQPRILHPWPSIRFAVKHLRYEPDAGNPHVRICAGGARRRSSLVRCGLIGANNISLISKESGEPQASLRSTNLCGRFGPASPSSAFHAERYPGTRHAADPAYKVVRRGALPYSSTIMVAKMSDAIVGIDVSKKTLDAYCAKGQMQQGRTFANSPDGWKLVRTWLKVMGSKQAHVCMEATGRHSLGVALALHEAGHVVSVVNPAQIRDFARTKLGRNKTDQVDAALIREYAELFKPEPWTPPSPAMRRLCELQTMRAGIIRSRAEWKNRIGSGLGDISATKLAAATIDHFTTQLEAIDRAISETIDQDAELHGRRDLLVSVIGVGDTLAALLMAKMPEPGVLRRSGEIVAYAGLNPSHHRSGTSIDRRRASQKSVMPSCGRRSTCRHCPRCASIPPLRPSSHA